LGISHKSFYEYHRDHIGNIRRKLRLCKREKIIKTISGRGYKIELDEDNEIIDISDLKGFDKGDFPKSKE